MKRLIVAVGCAVIFSGLLMPRQCLHGANETPEQQVRRKQAVGVARAVSTIQANQPGAAQKRYLRHEELASSAHAQKRPESVKAFNFAPNQEVLPGWELKVDVTADGYWSIMKDKTDPCGFAFISNTAGIIYTAEPIR